MFQKGGPFHYVRSTQIQNFQVLFVYSILIIIIILMVILADNRFSTVLEATETYLFNGI